MNINLEGTKLSTVGFVKLCAVNLLDLNCRHNVSLVWNKKQFRFCLLPSVGDVQPDWILFFLCVSDKFNSSVLKYALKNMASTIHSVEMKEFRYDFGERVYICQAF